ncbi:ABC transporter permease [Streptomyces akebiae]|uniref:ABC transporter permease n=1 Tax=Streptomyces akebiae TaxID=2865673 RepID=A0ABX8XK70_9ACTN|nr:ABC transporter permease [Streptomyces akebiae]QYX75945.1 ABC transporter permease [Streptomyces akebiae]
MTTTPVSQQSVTPTGDPITVIPRSRPGLRAGLRPRTVLGGWPRRLAAGVRAALPLAAALLVWYLLTANNVVLWLRFDKVPGPVEVFHTLRGQLTSGSYYQDLLASLRRILLGFGLAAVSGVAIGMAIGRSRVVQALVRPLIEVARPIPAIALVPLAILMFPTGEQGIVFITFFAAFFPVVVSTIHAMKTLPKVWEEAARTMGARRLSVLAHVVLPGAMPGIFSGLSVSMGVAWICVISAEMISGQFGIGYYTWQSYGLLDYSGVIVGMLSIGILGWGTAWLVERLGSRINRWLPRNAR